MKLADLETNTTKGDFPISSFEEEEKYYIQIGSEFNWFSVDEASWAETSFNASGILLPVTARIVTDATWPARIERTGVLTVQQL